MRWRNQPAFGRRQKLLAGCCARLVTSRMYAREDRFQFGGRRRLGTDLLTSRRGRNQRPSEAIRAGRTSHHHKGPSNPMPTWPTPMRRARRGSTSRPAVSLCQAFSGRDYHSMHEQLGRTLILAGRTFFADAQREEQVVGRLPISAKQAQSAWLRPVQGIAVCVSKSLRWRQAHFEGATMSHCARQARQADCTRITADDRQQVGSLPTRSCRSRG